METVGFRVTRKESISLERINHWIGGKTVGGESGRTGPVFNPATGVQTHEVDFATVEELDAAVGAARDAFPAWRATSLSKRADVLFRLRELLDQRKPELARVVSSQHGKVVSDAMGEIQRGIENIEYATSIPNLLKGGFSEQVSTGVDVFSIRQPLGVVAGITPFNFPAMVPMWMFANAIACGNTFILKPSEKDPSASLFLAELLQDAGVPDGVYVNLFATHEQVAGMIADPRLHGVSLTGSERAGTVVAETAGHNLKKVVLELGGSDPYIILDTGDVEDAAKTAWVTRMENVGQACNSNKRMIVMDDIYDDFVAALVKRATAMSPRQAGDDSPRSYSPMVSRKAAENLLAQVQDAVSKGATLHVGGTLDGGKGAYFAPAVLTGVTPDMRAYREELFGPVAVVYKVSNDDEAVQLANVVDFGLGGAVWSTDEERAIKVAEQLEVGMANVNTPAGEGADLPFGGTKRSGFGRELGPLGVDEFVNKRLFYVEK